MFSHILKKTFLPLQEKGNTHSGKGKTLREETTYIIIYI